MAVRVIIGKQEEELPSSIAAKLELVIRRTMDGDFMIMDHNDVDIIVMKDKKKVIAFPKETMSDEIYGTENRLFKFLAKKGLVDISSIQAGTIYGSLEARMLVSPDFDVIKMSLINIQKWMDEERPYMEFDDRYEEMTSDRFTDPSDEHSTELGEIPHGDQKGALQPMPGNAHYWLSYTYQE